MAFKLAKEALQADSVVVHYDSTKPLLLACDTSEYGIGAVLSHILDTGEEKPIAYASWTLNSAERHYSQLEREGVVQGGTGKTQKVWVGDGFPLLLNKCMSISLHGNMRPALS